MLRYLERKDSKMLKRFSATGDDVKQVFFLLLELRDKRQPPEAVTKREQDDSSSNFLS